jgi:hypothetical protein
VEGPPLKVETRCGGGGGGGAWVGASLRGSFRVQNEAASAQAKQPVVVVSVGSRGEERGGASELHGCGCFWVFCGEKWSRPVPCKKQSTVARNIA